jgi:non-canonical purine NTP pyrophosphatase (RdgB/HAM1 family)
MGQPIVFISYSHKDEAEKEQLLAHLGVLKGAELIEIWNDDKISAGGDWKEEIYESIAQVKVAILLITPNSLTSEFILDQEIPILLERREREGLTIFPVIAKACAWRTIDWLAKMNVKPKNGRPVWSDGGSHADDDLAIIAEEVAAIVKSIPPKLKYSSLIFVSRNEDKYREYRDLLGMPKLKISKMPIEEPQNMSLDLLVREKIKKVAPQLPDVPFFVEHTGLIIDAWKGLPGGLTSLFMDTVGNEGICKMMRGYHRNERRARARVVIGFFHPDIGDPATFPGEISGIIAPEPRGSANFGWDPIFIPQGYSKSYGEMSLAEKNQSSMRKSVVDLFKAYLADHFE